MGKKILLADDSITIQKVIELTFSDEDFEVVTVGNGRLALEKLSEVRPDIVLCDIIMPEKDGYEVCEQIKKNAAFSHVPVLLLTGAFEPFDQERAARAGYDGSLAKPFEPETLIAKVRDLLARAPQKAQVAAPPPPPPVVPFARPTPAAAAPTFVPAPPPPPAQSPSFISDEPFEMDEAEPVSVAPPPPPTPLREAPAPLAPMSEEESATLMAAPAVEMAEELEEDEPQSTSTVMFKATDLPWNMAPAPVTAPTPSVKSPAPEPLAPSFEREPEQEFEPDALDAAEVVEETAVFEEVVEGDDLAFQTSGAAFDEVADSGGATMMFSSQTLPPTPPPTPSPVPDSSATTASFVAREEEMTFEEPDLEPLPARELEPEPEPELEPEPMRLVPPPPVFVPEPVPPPPPPAPRAVTPPPMQAVRPPAPPLPLPVAPPLVPPAPPPAPPRIEPPPGLAPPPIESFADVAPGVEETTVPPIAPPNSEAAAVAVPVEMVEKIAQRVVAQISEKAVREIAWEIIPDLAEALIKQEIERLKAELQKI